MCCSTAAKITFNLYVMQPECYVWYEIRKDAVCSWVLDRELMTCPSSEPSDMIASMPHLPFPTLFPLLTKWLACKVTTVRPRWQRGSRTFQEAFLMLSQVWLLHLGSCFPPKGLMKASVPSSFVPPEHAVTWWCSLSVDCILGSSRDVGGVSCYRLESRAIEQECGYMEETWRRTFCLHSCIWVNPPLLLICSVDVSRVWSHYKIFWWVLFCFVFTCFGVCSLTGRRPTCFSYSNIHFHTTWPSATPLIFSIFLITSDLLSICLVSA